jgi:hypothetical protein
MSIGFAYIQAGGVFDEVFLQIMTKFLANKVIRYRLSQRQHLRLEVAMTSGF